MISFNFLLPTVGHEGLENMLNSINSQTTENDFITVVADKNPTNVKNVLSRISFRCNLNYFETDYNLGHGGFPVRNMYQNKLDGDFILHCDDDNVYCPSIIGQIKDIVSFDLNTVYLFRIAAFKEKMLIWKVNDLSTIGPGNIDTACGVLPNSKDYPDFPLYQWGDGLFYKQLIDDGRNVKLVDKVIYNWRPNQGKLNYLQSDEHKKHAKNYMEYLCAQKI